MKPRRRISNVHRCILGKPTISLRGRLQYGHGEQKDNERSCLTVNVRPYEALFDLLNHY